MGNACPSGFVSIGGGCVYNCSQDSGQFTPTLVGGQPKCALKTDSAKAFVLNPLSFLPLVNRGGTYSRATLDETRTQDPGLYAQYMAEQTRAREELAVLAGSLGKDTLLADAFRRLQAAENARDKAPGAYQKARTDYYTLLKGESWLAEERDRIAKADVDPVIQKYRNEYVALTTQMNQQQQAYDTMQAIKDKVFRVKDDLTYSAKLLTGQVDKVRAQILLDRRKRESSEEAPSWYGGVDTFLNVLLVIALLAAIWFVGKKLLTPASSKPSPAFTEAATTS